MQTLLNEDKQMCDRIDVNNLWKLFIGGDDRAYTELYNLYIDDLFAYGMCFTPDRESVKDCIQEVFISLYKNRSKQREISNIKCYLFTSLKNELFNMFKKSIEYYQIETVEPVFNVEYSVEDLFVKAETDRNNIAKVKELLEALSPKQNEVIYYRYVEEMSYDEIGELMHMNNQSVRNLVHRSIQKVRESMPRYVCFSLIIFQLLG
ncbi:sigma-70 family RNA polymerase sigma factor [uncultured Parabacteroides sp.]|uniref:RNA polymerase sigma factor n=1 Tax=uncultured Parabacteroides sp. TaxID=512312 RepID=UPI002599AC8D|nr:sigma-70 family RNA polymerase sigma factor [uncultured Parabacteroides sp.]